MSSATISVSAGARLKPTVVKKPVYSGPDSFAKFLERLLKYPDKASITVKDLLGGLESRAFGIPLAALSAGELVPVPIPGFSLVISVPMAAIGPQMIVDREQLFLPKSLLNRRLPGRLVKRIVRSMLPTVRRIDRFAQNRVSILTGTAGRRLAGLAVSLLAFLIALPVPGTNAPLALTVFIIAMGLIRGDGLLIAAGLVLTVVATALMGGAALALADVIFGV
jgi:hypothetical protein